MYDLHKRLAFTIENLPRAIPQSARIHHYFDVIRKLKALAGKYPHLIAGPKQLLPAFMSEFPSAVLSVGHGEYEQVIDVLPHGGEPLFLSLVPNLVAFWCENEWLLEGRKITFLFTSVDASILNTLNWAVPETLPFRMDTNPLDEAITFHWRDANALGQDCWSWPLELPFCDYEPTLGAQAGMDLLQAIHARGTLVNWFGGHNALVAADVQYHHTGPHEDFVTADMEWAASLPLIRLALDTGPFESELQSAHPGTVASCNPLTGYAIRAQNPHAQIGGNAYDWGSRKLFPQMSFSAVEVGQFRPKNRHMTAWKKYTVGRVNRLLSGDFWQIQPYLEPLVELAFELDPCDLTVAATRSLRDTATNRVWTDLDDDRLLSPAETFTRVVKWPLYSARAAAPAVQMAYRHRRHLTALGHDPLYLSGMVLSAMSTPLFFWHLKLKLYPPARAMRLQALSSELAYFGSLGFHIDRPSK
jgi:hypothetical protein